MARKQTGEKAELDPRYHDTWKLLKRYRDVVWSLELSVQQVKTQFQLEYGSSIEDFLETIYLAGADLGGTRLEDHARCIERSHHMLSLVMDAVELLRNKHKNGETYYWVLYDSYLSPQQLRNVDEIITQLQPHIRDISFRTYYRRRKEVVEALSAVLWDTAQESQAILEHFSLLIEGLCKRQRIGRALLLFRKLPYATMDMLKTSR